MWVFGRASAFGCVLPGSAAPGRAGSDGHCWVEGASLPLACPGLSFKKRGGWKLGFGWRGPRNLALAEGNNNVTGFIYLCAVCVASRAL